MVHYSMMQWLFFFYFYSFGGWCFESAYVSIKERKWVNRGFMRGPFLPLYGSGALMMFVVSMPFQDNVVLTYFAGCVGATALEYVTGVVMETLFKIRYWDYSDKKFNFQGRICLGSTIAWGFLTIGMTRIVHRPVEQFVLAIPRSILGYATFLLTIFIVADFTLSFKAALDIRDILVKMQRVKEEMVRMQKRLDVIVAFNNEEKEQKKQEREIKLDELAESLGQRLGSIKETIQNAPGAYVDNVRDEIADLRARYNLYMENRKQYKETLDFYKRDMLRNNPGMKSGRFKDTLDELKSVVTDKTDS
ncbi:MAG: hypothetical protein NC231_09430 [Bacillus sp. (in: Bacteria)]|nr:hypothetical protein [Bacillus sp. (in: firmicutes)]MCM1425091.1 hypothetical protein [Eubacterium sp.]